MRELAAASDSFPAEGIPLPLIASSSAPNEAGRTEPPQAEVPHTVRRRGRMLSVEELERMRERTLPNGTRVPGGLPAWLWSFAPGETIAPRTLEDIPTKTEESALLAKSFKALGGVFLGPVTAYALMCAVGMVDAHLLDSHRRGCSGLFIERQSLSPDAISRGAAAEGIEKPHVASFDATRGRRLAFLREPDRS